MQNVQMFVKSTLLLDHQSVHAMQLRRVLLLIVDYAVKTFDALVDVFLYYNLLNFSS